MHETHPLSIIIEVDTVDGEDVEEIAEMRATIEAQINNNQRSGVFTLSSGQTGKWFYEQPVH
jgi:hypothetical protein